MYSSDARTNTFTEEGRILQVEYAIKNVSRAGTMLGYVCTDGVLLLGLKKGISSSRKEKIYKISPQIYVAMAGISSDALQLLSYARIESEKHCEHYCAEIPLKSLCTRVGELKQGFTQGGGKRPFGVSFIYAGMQNDDYALYSTDPSGSVLKWHALCCGEFEDVINASLKNGLKQGICLDEATREVMKIIKVAREIKDEDLKLFEILHFKKDEKRFLTLEEIKSYLS
ncbi:hypothetical protein EDEG_01917 [Edhazardia aedis USNM 41457]|uniref:Proteasome alpha-type subunits domain-containing protein n=1 Tax=Edhazardia aedis (strain USNM 41457) TaxID=1003232 RepID=J8ZVU3_EDHAE|nr:hypothetical protein EDEG_01917 [Edhazardia aedis USNM 41457]|eukprot:EJW03788.1 hypothetical protein EDEG_01917 [Edhazardia aedis USNM 41457]